VTDSAVVAALPPVTRGARLAAARFSRVPVPLRALVVLMLLLPASAWWWFRQARPASAIEAPSAIAGPLVEAGEIDSLSFAPDGSELALAAGQKAIQLLRVPGWKPDQSLDAGAAIVAGFAHAGHLLATAEKPTIRLWNSADGQQLGVLTGHTDWVTGLSFSPDDRTLASGSDDQTVRFWDVPGLSERPDLRITDIAVTCLAYSPDGARLAFGSRDGNVRLKVLKSGAVQNLGHHELPVTSLAFSPDGGLLASGSEDQTIHLWNLASARQLPVLQAGKPVRSVAISPGGTRLAAGTDEGSVRLWSLPEGKDLPALVGHQGPVISLAFARSRSPVFLASGSRDKTVRLWRLQKE
jgi:WD40 repeat protein